MWIERATVGELSTRPLGANPEPPSTVSMQYAMHEDLLMILAVAELSHAIKCGVKRGESLAPRLDDAEDGTSLNST